MTSADERRRTATHRGWLGRLFHRRPDHEPVVRMGISALDPVAEVRALRSLGDRMLEIQRSMTDSVCDLQEDLAEARGATTGYRPPFRGSALPPHSADVIGEAVALEDSVTTLHEQLDALWFERQWLSAQLAVAKGEFRLPPRAQG